MNKTLLRALRTRYEKISENPKLSDLEGEYQALGALCDEVLDALSDTLDAMEELESEADDMRERLEVADLNS